MLKKCPACKVEAIPVFHDTEPTETVTCGSCQAEYQAKDLA